GNLVPPDTQVQGGNVKVAMRGDNGLHKLYWGSNGRTTF
ncbi:MAG: hypothetical protein ACI9ZD_000691, partial [Paracoccaceae bacterium]